MKLGTSFVAVCLAAGVAHADTTPQPLPFVQDWTTAAPTLDNWSGVPGVIGYRGENLVLTDGVDPRTVVADGSGTSVDAKLATSGTFGTGAVTYFNFATGDDTVGIAGSGTADVPHVVFTVNTTGVASVRVRFVARDLDPSADNAVQQIALQYRVGTTGAYANVAGGYIADATAPGTDTTRTAIDVTLPVDAANQPVVQVRVLTTNATGADEYVGIDDIIIGDPVPPVCGNGTIESGEACDDANVAPGDGCNATCAVETGYECTASSPSVCTDIDECMRSTDNCDVGESICTNTPGSFTCACAAGFEGNGVLCTDVDECAQNLDTCSDTEGTCTNTQGSFTCACNAGYTGDGVTCADIDECGAGTDTCSDDATCANLAGSFACTCNVGYVGDGQLCEDLDECATQMDDCDENASCTNNPGSFACACRTGYEGDGRTCTTIATCGDGVIDETDACDDGNVMNGDGCSSVCVVEAGFVCTGEPSVCRGDSDSDGVPNVDDVCPMDANPAQTDSDGDGVGDACEEIEDGGCCSTSREGDAGGWLLAFATMIGLRRRRR